MRASPPPLAKLPRRQAPVFRLQAESVDGADDEFSRFSASVTEPRGDVTGVGAEDDDDHVTRIKCVLVGDGAIGKTSLIVSYTTNGYPTEYEPTAFDNYAVMVTVDNQPIRLQLCDTAGQDDFDSLRPLCYPGADVFLLCFSVVAPASWHNIRCKWLPEIRRHAPGAALVLVGTQCDLRADVKELITLAKYAEQPVSASDARKTMKEIGAPTYVECSALTQHNLKEVFDAAILAGLENRGLLERVVGGKGKGKKEAKKKGAKEKGGEDDGASKKSWRQDKWWKCCCLS